MEKIFEIFISRLKTVLLTALPGVSAHYMMAPPYRDLKIPDGDKNIKESAVIALLFPENGKIKILMMKRVQDFSVHSGQISFPGGKKELQDANLKETALRELHEEVGIQPSQIEILGGLTPLYISVSGYKVFPFLAFSKRLPPLMPNNAEVEKIIKTDIEKLTARGAKTKQHVTTKYIQNFEVPCFIVENEILWGATAMITNEIIELLKRIKPLRGLKF